MASANPDLHFNSATVSFTIIFLFNVHHQQSEFCAILIDIFKCYACGPGQSVPRGLRKGLARL